MSVDLFFILTKLWPQFLSSMYHASCDFHNSSKLTPLSVQTNMAARSDKTPCFIYATSLLCFSPTAYTVKENAFLTIRKHESIITTFKGVYLISDSC